MTPEVNPNVDSLISDLSPELAASLGQAPNDPAVVAPPPSETMFVIPGAPPMPPPTPAEVKKFEAEVHTANNATVSPALKRLGEISRMVPGAELIRVYKKDPNGKLGHIVDLQIRDVKASGGDLEAHINRYIRPRYKGGEYHTSIVDPNGKLINAGIFNYFDPPEEHQDNGALSLVRELITKQEMARAAAAPPVDPLEQIVKTQETMKKLKELTGGGASDPMTMFMAMQVMQPPKPAMDPGILAILDRMDRRAEQVEKQLSSITSAPPMLPLPPPPPSGLAAVLERSSLTDLAAAVAAISALFRRDDPDKVTLKDLIPLLQPKPDPNQLGIREIITLLDARRTEEKPANTLQDQMEAMLKFREFIEQVAPQQQSQGSTFWDALGNLFNQEGFGSNLGKAISGAMHRRDAPAPRPQVDVQVGPRQLAPAPAGQLPANEATPAPTPADNKIYMPENIFRPACDEIAQAQNDAGRIQGVVNLLAKLAPEAQWQPFVMEVFSKTAANEQQDVLLALQGFFALCVRAKLLSKDAAVATVRAVHANWIEVHQEVCRQMKRPPLVSRGDVPITPPAPATVDVANADTDEDEDETDEDEEADESDDEVVDEGPHFIDVGPEAFNDFDRGDGTPIV